MDIMILANGVPTLVDIVITNPIPANLVSHAILSHGVATIVASWVKDDFYCNQYSMNMFIFLAIKVLDVCINKPTFFFH
jgi:hypothetical protein